MVIDPAICIDCAICEPECPVNAIVSDRKLKPEDTQWLDFNTEMSKVWPNIRKVKEPMPGHTDINYTGTEAWEKVSKDPYK